MVGKIFGNIIVGDVGQEFFTPTLGLQGKHRAEQDKALHAVGFGGLHGFHRAKRIHLQQVFAARTGGEIHRIGADGGNNLADVGQRRGEVERLMADIFVRPIRACAAGGSVHNMPLLGQYLRQLRADAAVGADNQNVHKTSL